MTEPSTTELVHSRTVEVDCPPETLYAMVSDVTRTGEWSPVCRACWWDAGAGPAVGSWFTGRNQTATRVWETRSQVVVADPGREFAFLVGGSLVRWGFTMVPVEGTTELTQSWEFLPAGQAMFHQRYGADAQAQILDRTQAAHDGIPQTLAAIKAAAELA